MNNDELIMALREQRGKMPMTVPLEEIISRGRAVRVRRRIPTVTAAVVAPAATAVALSMALSGGHPAVTHPGARRLVASHPASGPGVQLAAWTVTRQAGGSIKVTFRQATDAAGLQRTLRADGVPVSVTFAGQQNPACRPYPGVQAKPSAGQSFGGPLAGVVSRNFLRNLAQAYTTPYALVIDPSALPSGAGLQIWTSGTPGAADNFQLNVSLVQASPQCTGS
jgi:hypothetical protein